MYGEQGDAAGALPVDPLGAEDALMLGASDGEMPPGEPFDGAWFDGSWFDNASFDDASFDDARFDGPSAGPVSEPDPGPAWPPDGLPVVLWPAELLREALAGGPGVRLAKLVAEAADVDGNLDEGHDRVGGSDGAGGAGAPHGRGVLAELPDEVLSEMSGACARLQSWAAGIQARVVAERAARETHPLAHASLVGEVTGELAVTGVEGTEVVVRGESGAQHPTVIAALVAGRIDVKKAHTLLRSATQLTVAERAEAIRRYLPEAPRRTWIWLRTRMLAFAKARHGSAESARDAARRRSVSLDRAENDMGWLSAYLPAVDAAAVWGVVDDMAHQLQRTAGEDRNLSQLRADSLTGIVTGRLLPADRFADVAESAGGNGDGGGNRDASGNSDLGGNGDAGGPGDAGGNGDLGRSGKGSTEAARPEVPVCTCGGRAPVVQEVIRPVRVTPTRPVVRVTVPASALLGLDDAPGDLAGFGPVPAETARMIAQDATWQRLLTDPVTGVLTDYSTTTYRPGRVLRGAVEARDGTCRFLSCDTPADRCDLDHIEPFDHDQDDAHAHAPGAGVRGQTNAHNLHPLCRRHHLLKTHGGWGVVRDSDTGVATWTSPTGRTHVRQPTVLDTHVEIGDVDPDTSFDLTVRALTGRSLPRPYRTSGAGAGAGAGAGTRTRAEAEPGEPPF